MAEKISVKKLIAYWQITAEHDYETMLDLYKIKRYSDSLFFGHIVLEKILKAHTVKATGKDAPKIHNLLRLEEMAGCKLTEGEKDFLGLVNSFNISTRYPDYKLAFYKRYSSAKAVKGNLNKIIRLYQRLCQELNK